MVIVQRRSAAVAPVQEFALVGEDDYPRSAKYVIRGQSKRFVWAPPVTERSLTQSREVRMFNGGFYQVINRSSVRGTPEQFSVSWKQVYSVGDLV